MTFISIYILLSSCTASTVLAGELKEITSDCYKNSWDFAFYHAESARTLRLWDSREEQGQCSPVWRRPRETPWNLLTLWLVTNFPIHMMECHQARWLKCFCYNSYLVAYNEGDGLKRMRSLFTRLCIVVGWLAGWCYYLAPRSKKLDSRFEVQAWCSFSNHARRCSYL